MYVFFRQLSPKNWVSYFPLQELDFVAATSESAADVLARSNKLFVRQRCRLLMAAARTLIAKPYVDVVEVTDEDEGAAYSIT